MADNTLRLPRRTPENPNRLRFVERKGGRYILQELNPVISASATVSFRWRDVPLVPETP